MRQMIVVTSILTTPTAALAQVCEPTIVHQGPIECAGAQHPVIAGNLLYLPIDRAGWCVPETGLWIYDISDPHAPRQRGHFRTGDAGDVAVTGDLAVMTSVESSRGFLRTIDVSDPDSPRLLGELMFDKLPRSVALAGSTAYVTGSDFGLVVVDVGDPRAPVIVSSLELPGRGLHVAVERDIVYVAERDSGLHIIDVADPAAPVEVAVLPITAGTYRVAVHDSAAYVATAEGVGIVDAHDPSAPSVLATIAASSIIQDVLVRPPLLWIGTFAPREAELLAFDISDPHAPLRQGALLFTGERGWGTVLWRGVALALRGDVAYVIDNMFVTHDMVFGISTVDISSCTICLADCDASGSLDFFDILCFQNLFAAGDPAADCDGSGELDLFDFLCFQNHFAVGCP